MSGLELEQIARECQTLGEVIAWHAGRRGEREALEFQGRRLTYRELDRRADQIARRLLAAGLTPGRRVAILARNTDRFFELFYGAVRAGVVLVPVNFRLAPGEVAYVVNDARAELLFVGPEYEDLVAGIEGELPGVAGIVSLGEEGSRWQSFESWAADAPPTSPDVAVSPDDTAIQIYSSGTTGHPKGVELTHRNLLTLMNGALREWGGWSDQDVVQVVMPLFHVAGCEWGFLGFHVGGRVVLLPDVDPPAILRNLEEAGVTRTLYVPAVILFLLQTPGVRETDFSRLRAIYYGASPIPLPVLEEALEVFRCDFVQLYGLTETTGAVTWLPPEDHRGERLKSCGKALPTARIQVVDEHGHPCPPGVVGEIAVAGAQIMKGYWRLPEETARARRGEWFLTGDAGYFDEDGYLYIHDRIKDMIVSGGENVYPAEIESVLAAHPEVADVAVIGIPDERWGETVKAIVVPAPGARPSPEALERFARERLAGFKIPRSWDFVDALPRNPSGKILKRVLREPYWKGEARRVH